MVKVTVGFCAVVSGLKATPAFGLTSQAQAIIGPLVADPAKERVELRQIVSLALGVIVTTGKTEQAEDVLEIEMVLADKKLVNRRLKETNEKILLIYC